MTSVVATLFLIFCLFKKNKESLLVLSRFWQTQYNESPFTWSRVKTIKIENPFHIFPNEFASAFNIYDHDHKQVKA